MTAKFLLTSCEPDVDPQRAALLARLIAMRGYSRAELLLAMQTVPFDARASHNYGRGLNAADVERVIAEHRKLRAMLDRTLTARQMYDLCEQFAQEISPSDFGICGYDVNDRPFYRFAKQSGPHKHDPRPQLEEKTRPDREGEGGGTALLAEVMKRQQGGDDA